jgi:hypothetical protein
VLRSRRTRRWPLVGARPNLGLSLCSEHMVGTSRVG